MMKAEDYKKKPINQPEETTEPNNNRKTTDVNQDDDLNQKTQDPTGFTESYWNDKRARLKKKYPELSEEDLNYELSKHDTFINNISTKLGKTPGEFNNLLDEL